MRGRGRAAGAGGRPRPGLAPGAALALGLLLAGCGGDEGGTATAPAPPATPPPPSGPPPRAVETPVTVNLAQGGAARRVRLADLFEADPAAGTVTWRAASGDPGVAAAAVEGTGIDAVLVVTPVGPGTVRITVTATNGGGAASKAVEVTVLTASTTPPRAVEPVEPIILVDGGAERLVPLERLFSTFHPLRIATLAVEVASENEGVVTAAFVADPAAPAVRVVPVAVGEAGLVLSASNGAGAATQRLPVAVRAAETLRVSGEVADVVLVAGARGLHWTVADVFEPAGFRLAAESLDEAVVVAAGVDGYGGSLTLAPVGPGETPVVLTAENAAGSARATVAVTVLEKLRIGLANRAGSGGGTLRLAEGAGLSLEIRPLERALAAEAPGLVQLRIAVEGPEGQLEVPETVTVARLGHFDERAAFAVEALADEADGEDEAIFAVSLSPEAEGLPPWMEIVTDAVLLTVRDAPAADCAVLAVDGSVRQRSGRRTTGDFVIQSAHPDASVSFISPYLERESRRSPWRNAAANIFPDALPYRGMPEGFEQTVRLRWWDGDLRFRLTAPGCEPVEMVCAGIVCGVE